MPRRCCGGLAARDEPAQLAGILLRLGRASIWPGRTPWGGRGTGHSPAEGGRRRAKAQAGRLGPAYAQATAGKPLNCSEILTTKDGFHNHSRTAERCGRSRGKVRPRAWRGGAAARDTWAAILRGSPSAEATAGLAQAGVCGERSSNRWTGTGLSAAGTRNAVRTERLKARRSATPTSIAERVTSTRRNEEGLARAVPLRTWSRGLVRDQSQLQT